jgi:8-oxo-dGTP diphosphatase
VSPVTDADGVVQAAGGVVWRPAVGGPEVLVVHRPRYRDWSLPKGKLEPGESHAEGAVREVAEETGYACVLGPEVLAARYRDAQGRPKLVRYWAMTPEAGDGAFVPGDEVDEIEWLSIGDARLRMSYRRDLAVLDAFVVAVEP